MGLERTHHEIACPPKPKLLLSTACRSRIIGNVRHQVDASVPRSDCRVSVGGTIW